MSSFNCTKRDIILPYIEGGRTMESLSKVLLEKLNVSENDICFIISDIQRCILPFFNKRWALASRKKGTFLEKNNTWLDTGYSVNLLDSDQYSTPSTSGQRGRPCVAYLDSSESTKKRKNTLLLAEYGFEHISKILNTAEITGVDETLIKRLYIILQVLSSGMMIDPEKFGEYATETARVYVSKYNWYYMPSSIHKMLIHGENIIKHFAVLPIGQLSEDAQESRNKDYRNMRLHHARKCSRKAANEDVFKTLLYTSDPYITSLRKPYTKNVKDLEEEALTLLKVAPLETEMCIDPK